MSLGNLVTIEVPLREEDHARLECAAFGPGTLSGPTINPACLSAFAAGVLSSLVSGTVGHTGRGGDACSSRKSETPPAA